MKAIAAVLAALILLVGGAYLARGQAQPGGEAPRTVYADVQALQAQAQAANAEIKGLEFQVERLRAERKNYRCVKTKNADLIARLSR